MDVMHMQLDLLLSIPQAQQNPDEQQPRGWQANNRKLQSFLPDLDKGSCTLCSSAWVAIFVAYPSMQQKVVLTLACAAACGCTT